MGYESKCVEWRRKLSKLLLQACVPFMDLKDNARFFIGKIHLKILINYVQIKKMSITKGR